jgi:hypothetical protein
MPTFYFGISDGYRINPDEDGFPASGIEAAYEMAVRKARHMLAMGEAKGEDLSGWAFRVYDGRGVRVFTLPFSVAPVDPHYARAAVRRGRAT